MAAMLRDMVSPYSAAEAWIYDVVVAPAVREMVARAGDELLGDLPAGARCLDVGCGGGQNAAWLADQRVDISVTGLDLNPGQVARARRRHRHLAPRVSFVRGSALDLPFADGTFDAVISIASVKHWPDARRGLAECTRVLRPGGRLLVAEADRGCKHADAAAFVRRWRWVMPGAGPLMLALFRTWVAGRSFDAGELEALAATLPLSEARVTRTPDMPGLMLRGRAR